jgi:YD repeat-containing protein
MAEPGLISPPDPTPLESDSFLPRLFGITATVVAIALIVVAITALISPDWLRMHTERRFTMVTPGEPRKAPDAAVLASYAALPTGWHGAPIPLFPGQAAPSRWSVNLANGAFIHVQTDVYLPDIVPINLSRTYSSFDDADRDFGAGSSASYEIYLLGNNTVYSYIDMMFPDGSIVHMPRISPGTSWDATYEHRAKQGDSTDIFDKAKLWWHSPWYFSSLKDGTGIVFPASRWAQQWGQRAAIMIQDAKGNVLDIKRDEPGNIVEIKSPNGQRLILGHDEQHRITGASGSNGYIVYYSYDEDGRLKDVSDSQGNVTGYSYDIDNNMLAIVRPDGRTWLTNKYDKRHRVTDQTYLDGTQASYKYSAPDPSGITITEVTRPDKSIDTYTFSKEGRLINHTQQPSPGPPKT